ncbi:hypothetical protein Tco_0983290 [Tanacetum coccineum]
MQNYLKSDIIWESRKEDLSLQIPKKPVQGSKKYVPSLHKYLAVPFPENDLEELTSRWVSKRVKRFNLYARYSVEHWKTLWEKQHHIRRQEQKRDNPDEVYS